MGHEVENNKKNLSQKAVCSRLTLTDETNMIITKLIDWFLNL